MFAYVDESGNTGAKLLDKNQPLFITAALLTRSDFDKRFGDQVRAIAKAAGADEIHAADMGIGGIEAIAQDLLKVLRRAGPAFALARVEKRYVIATKVFDTLFDSFENKAVPWHAYNEPSLRMLLVFKVAFILDEPLAERFLEALMEPNDKKAWAKMADFCRDLIPRVQLIPDARSREIVCEALQWIVDNSEALHFVHSDKVGRKSHLPNLIGFGNLLNAIETRSAIWKRPVEVIRHDRQHEFAAGLKFWHDMYSNAKQDVVQMPFGGRMVLRRVFGSTLEISNAKDSPGIQMIDVILWLFARAQREDLPPACQSILDYVYDRGHLDDFSFAAAEVNTLKLIERVEARPLPPGAAEDAAKLRAELEERRQAGMREYAMMKAAKE